MRKRVLALAMAAMMTLGAASAILAEGGGSKQKGDHVLVHGKVTAVDAEAGTISLTNKQGEANTFTIPAGAKVVVNGNAATLGDIRVDMFGGVKLLNGTPVHVKASDATYRKNKSKNKTQ